MYVLMDLEWVTNNRAFFSPTQIAAMRVNDVWEQQSIFYSRIRPRDSSFYDWKHMGYTGGTSFDFLHAPGIHQVLTNLEEWLEEDDVICIWAEDAKNILAALIIKIQADIERAREQQFDKEKMSEIIVGSAAKYAGQRKREAIAAYMFEHPEETRKSIIGQAVNADRKTVGKYYDEIRTEIDSTLNKD